MSKNILLAISLITLFNYQPAFGGDTTIKDIINTELMLLENARLMLSIAEREQNISMMLAAIKNADNCIAILKKSSEK